MINLEVNQMQDLEYRQEESLGVLKLRGLVNDMKCLRLCCRPFWEHLIRFGYLV